jgi:hypothetical protein
LPTPSFKGQKNLQTQSSDYNAKTFHIRQELAKLSTTQLVRVVSVNVVDRVSPVGYVDVQPLVTQMDGQGNPVPHGIIYNIPYVRIQGGANAVIIDPQVDDIGMCNFSDRDISRVKETKDTALPGSKRMMSMADGLYTGGLLNGTPERYLLIDDNGIEIEGAAQVNIFATNVNVEAETVTVTATDKIKLIASTLLEIVSPLTTISGILDVGGNILAKANIVLTGGIAGVGGVPAKADSGFEVNGKVIDDVHEHSSGAYAAGGDAVTGDSGGVT